MAIMVCAAINEMPDRHLVVQQALRNTDMLAGVGTFLRNGVLYYHYNRNGDSYVAFANRLEQKQEYQLLNPA